ncbi:MAG: beta-N-acetylhexosaminidase [Bacteroidales bacterium]|nr:beta-N-acetylhexosaminidase [Bacteroidales bacterium]
MSQKIISILCMLLIWLSAHASNVPKVSTEGNVTWYLLQFLNGGKVITAQEQGEVSVASAKNDEGQWWKLTGTPTQGYTFTNKLGYVLHVSAAAQNQKVKAKLNATEITTFSLQALSSEMAYEITPTSNNQVAMNLWGGATGNRGVGLWTKGDVNNPIVFISEQDYNALGRIAIVPYPKQLNIEQEGLMPLSKLQTITYPNDSVKPYVEAFATQLSTTSKQALNVQPTPSSSETGYILLTIDNTLAHEAYTLHVTEGSVVIKASSRAGFFYALQSLKQLLPRAFFSKTTQDDIVWGLPYVNIIDEPQLGYRGFMLDVARHFFSKEEVKRILDVMALYKMNRFHWHLTDDQGWRIEIPKYPRLTEVGAIRARSYTNPGQGGQFFDDTEYGRGLFYTKADLQEIVTYAKERNIEILPEVDLPGHMVAAIAAYPEFSCDPSKHYEVRVNAGISHDVLNVGDDRVIEFLEDVMDYLAEIFPYPYIHLGGDECPTDAWRKNAQCLERVRQHNLTGVEQLQAWLVNHLGTYIQNKHQKGVVVWDELTLHWNSKFQIKPIVMAWNVAPDPGGKYTNRTPSQVAADLGLKSIYVPWNKLYLDWMQASPSALRIDEPYHGGWGDNSVNSVETVYNTSPTAELSGRETFCLGVQGNLWTETTNDAEEMEYQTLPRLLALSETGWLPTTKKNWTSFYKRLQAQGEILDALEYSYAKHYITPKPISAERQILNEATQVLAKSLPGAVGYASQQAYDALQEALNQARSAIEGNTSQAGPKAEQLRTALATFKQAPIVQPQAGKTYQIKSASTYYKRQFAGSSLYLSGNKLRIHYTPQIEPEELWQFVPTDGGFVLKSQLTEALVQLPAYGQNAQTNATNGTPLRIDKATVPNGGYTYIPGVVVLSSIQGYQPYKTGYVKRLNATLSGEVNALDSLGLCHSGTWVITEVTDFTQQLQGLCRKAEFTLRTAKIGEMNQPTTEALNFLRHQVLQPATEAVRKGQVNETLYKQYATLYAAFLAMERTSLLASISTQHYYRLRNIWFDNRYATANNTNKQVIPSLHNNSDLQLWQFVKKEDGTVLIYNKGTGTAAYISGRGADQTLFVGKPYAWTLEERTLDGKTGICIMNREKTVSWYTNPNSWSYVLTKPFWGASTWALEKTSEEVITNISSTPIAPQAEQYYDLLGRSIYQPTSGIYLNSRSKKIVFK